MRIYLACNYASHPTMREVAAKLGELGHEVTSRWITGAHEADDPTQGGDHARYAREDIDDLVGADVCFWFSVHESARQRGGRHVEFGFALAANIPLYVIGRRENVFHYLPQVKNFPDLESAIKALGQ